MSEPVAESPRETPLTSDEPPVAELSVAEPPVADEERLARVRLSLVPGIGPLLAQALLDRFETAAAVFRHAAPQWREVPGIGPKLVAALEQSTPETAQKELARCRRANVRVLIPPDADYPSQLLAMPDAPGVLSMRGQLTAADEVAVALVGSRKSTLYGQQMAERLARGLAAAGVTVVSGLARGIDAAAHRGALAAGGRTLAVVAGGLARLYPPEHRDLARAIVEAGAVLTESPLDREPTRGLFPQRNRIISGLCLGVVIVEATRRSGALHTARHAHEQNREVMAVPGHVTDLSSEGCHDLLRDGATLVRHVDDILEALGPLPLPSERPASADEPARTVLGPRELTLSDQERRVLEAVPQQPTPRDDVVAVLAGDVDAPVPEPQVLATLMVLEMRRFVATQPGGFVQRVPG